MAGDGPVLSAGPPIETEPIQGVSLVITSVLPPVCVGRVECVSLFEITGFDRTEETVDGARFRPMSEPQPADQYHDRRQCDDRRHAQAPLRRPWIVFFGIQQGHVALDTIWCGRVPEFGFSRSALSLKSRIPAFS